MKRLVMVLLFSFTISRGHAQRETTFEECSARSDRYSQAGLNQCASEDAKRAEAELAAVYKGFVKQIANDTLAIAKLRKAEAAWRIYRKAYIAAVYPAEDKQAAYGTEFPMDLDLLWAKLTREHVEAMRYLINEYQPPQ